MSPTVKRALKAYGFAILAAGVLGGVANLLNASAVALLISGIILVIPLSFFGTGYIITGHFLPKRHD